MIRRTRPLLVLTLIALITACVPTNVGTSEYRNAARDIKLASVDELYRFLTYTENRYPLVSAHRGGPTTGFPENAIETFENSHRYQPLHIEHDVDRNSGVQGRSVSDSVDPVGRSTS